MATAKPSRGRHVLVMLQRAFLSLQQLLASNGGAIAVRFLWPASSFWSNAPAGRLSQKLWWYGVEVNISPSQAREPTIGTRTAILRIQKPVARTIRLPRPIPEL